MNATAPPYFDQRLDAWVLSRYRDVAAALREPLLVPVSARCMGPATPIETAGHAHFRAGALRALAPPALQQLEARIALLAASMAGALPTDRPVDLVEEYARPWSLEVARIPAGVPCEHLERLAGLARSGC
jgi:cytochrome P450